MNSIWNPHAFGVSGNPVGPEVNTLRAYGAEPTAELIAMAQHTFAKFCMTERLSFVPNQTQSGVLPDGSTYRIVVVGNTRFMEVVPVETKIKDEIYTAGFVFAIPSERHGMLDAVLENGAHTGKWKGVIISRADFIKLHADGSIYNLRPSIRGPSGLPYSFLGRTFGIPLFDYSLIAPRMLFAFGNKKVYSLSEDVARGKLVCTISELSENPEIGQQQPPSIESERVVDVSDMVHYLGHFDCSFSGREVLVRVPNKKIMTEVVADSATGECYEENPGLNYSKDENLIRKLLGSEYDGPDKYKVYERSEDSFSFARDISLPPDEVFPPQAAYEIVSPYFAKSYTRRKQSALNVSTPPGPRPKGHWSVAGLELVTYNNGRGRWKGFVTATYSMPSVFSAKYESTRYSFMAPPKFSFNGITTDLVIKSVYKYDIIGAGDQLGYYEGPLSFGDFPIEDAYSQMESAGAGTIEENNLGPGTEYAAHYLVGTRSTDEVSSRKTTTNVFGREFVLDDSASKVFASSSANSGSGVLPDGKTPYDNLEGFLNYFSRAHIKEILIYDPHLSLLCYTEHKSSMSHSFDSETHSVFTGYGDNGAEFITSAQCSAGAKPKDCIVTKNRLVIEQHGAIQHIFDIPPGDKSYELHAGGFRLNFDKPAAALVNPPDDIINFPEVSPAKIMYKERNIGIVLPAGITGERTTPIGTRVAVMLDYKKSPATGAAIIDLYRYDTSEFTHFAVTSKGIKLLPAALLEAELESTPETSATTAI